LLLHEADHGAAVREAGQLVVLGLGRETLFAELASGHIDVEDDPPAPSAKT
jgi:hypothetical protein